MNWSKWTTGQKIASVIAVFVILLAAGMLVVASAATGQGSSGSTGQDYIKTWPEAWRLTYAVGFTGGFQAGSLRNELEPIQQVRKCLTTWKFGQTQAIIDKFVRDNPAKWHESISVLALEAIVVACRQSR